MSVDGLNFQSVELKFTEGMDTKTNKKLSLPAKWNLVRNGTLTADYAISKRDGITPLVATQNSNCLATHDNELLAISGQFVRSIQLATSPAVSVGKPGQLGFVETTSKPITNTGSYQDQFDCAYGNGFTVYVYRQFTSSIGIAVSGINVNVVDEQTGNVVASFSPRSTATSHHPRVVFSHDVFYVLYADSATASIYARVYIPTEATGTLGAETVVENTNVKSLAFDAESFILSGNSRGCLFAYGWTDGVTSVRAKSISSTAPNSGTEYTVAVGSSVNVITEAQLPNANLVSVGCTMLGVWAGIVSQGIGATAMCGIAARLIDSTMALTSAAVQVDSSVGVTAGASHICGSPIPSTNSALICADRRSEIGTNGQWPIRSVIITTTNGTNINISVGPQTIANSNTYADPNFIVAATPVGPQGPFIYGKPIIIGNPITTFGASILPVAVSDTLNPQTGTTTLNQQSSFFLIDAVAGPVVGKAQYGSFLAESQTFISGTPSTNGGSPCSTPVVPSGYAIAGPVLTTLAIVTSATGTSNLSQSNPTRLTISPNTTRSFIKAQLGTSTYFAGGMLSTFDGNRAVEQGFALFPEGIYAAGNGAGTGNVHDGTYQVVAIYEWIDGANQRHQSAPSLPQSVVVNTGGANTGSITIKVPTLPLTQKQLFYTKTYVTQNAGTIFNYSGVTNYSSSGAFSTSTITADITTLASNEILYTQPDQSGTTLANDAPGPCTAIGVHQGRLWANDSDNPLLFRYSQQLVNTVGLQFNESLSGMLPTEAASVVGFSSLDDKQIIFGQRKLYVVTGSGPNSAGLNNGYSDPIEIPSDVGCSEPRSILKMPFGIIFKSAKGFYLLSRDLSTRYIGEGVAAFDSNDVTSAVLLEDRQECRFTSTSGTQLIYCYQVNAWATTQIASSATSNSLYQPADAVWWPTLGVYVSTSLLDGLNKDQPGVYSDQVGTGSQTAVNLTLRTSFLHMASLEGFQRVRWLYLTTSAPSAPNSTLGILVDYDDIYSAVTPPGAPGEYSISKQLGNISFPNPACIDLRHKLVRQKCKSVAFTFTDNPAAPGEPGLNGFQAILMQVGIKKGTNKLPAAQSIG